MVPQLMHHGVAHFPPHFSRRAAAALDGTAVDHHPVRKLVVERVARGQRHPLIEAEELRPARDRDRPTPYLRRRARPSITTATFSSNSANPATTVRARATRRLRNDRCRGSSVFERFPVVGGRTRLGRKRPPQPARLPCQTTGTNLAIQRGATPTPAGPAPSSQSKRLIQAVGENSRC